MTLMRFSDRFPALFDHIFDNEMTNWSNRNYSNTNTTLPSVNIKEDEEAFHVEMAAPGLEKKDFNIELENNVLTISSEKEIKNEEKEGEKFTRQEFSYQSFSRSFNLPEIVESDKIKAKYEHGILKIDIPKKEEAKPKPAKKISIS